MMNFYFTEAWAILWSLGGEYFLKDKELKIVKKARKEYNKLSTIIIKRDKNQRNFVFRNLDLVLLEHGEEVLWGIFVIQHRNFLAPSSFELINHAPTPKVKLPINNLYQK